MTKAQNNDSIAIRIGSYLGRTVSVVVTETIDGPVYPFDSALILVYAATESTLAFTGLYTKLMKSGALGIFVSGENVNLQFETLLEQTSEFQTLRHVNTGKFTSNDFFKDATDFFISAIPAPELFDDWSQYILFYFGDPDYADDNLQAAIDSIENWLLS